MNSFPRNEYIEEARKSAHSIEFVRETVDYADHLAAARLPVLYSLKHLGLALNVSRLYLKDLIRNRAFHYEVYRLKKKTGGFRTIAAPDDEMKWVQRWILRNILDLIPVGDPCVGFVKGRSIVNGALPHSGQEVVLKCDLANCFGTISERRVYRAFRDIGYHTNLSVDLAKITTRPVLVEEDLMSDLEGVLPEGAPTSPALSNLVLADLDRRLAGLVRKSGACYTRYADDITFSGPADSVPSLTVIRMIVEQEGFRLNDRKTSVRRQNARQVVLGLTVNSGVRVSGAEKRSIWRHLYYCQRFGVYDHLQRLGESRRNFKDWLLGKICFVFSVEPETGRKMFDAFDQIDWPL